MHVYIYKYQEDKDRMELIEIVGQIGLHNGFPHNDRIHNY